jgi:hypothetical protein
MCVSLTVLMLSQLILMSLKPYERHGTVHCYLFKKLLLMPFYTQNSCNYVFVHFHKIQHECCAVGCHSTSVVFRRCQYYGRSKLLRRAELQHIHFGSKIPNFRIRMWGSELYSSGSGRGPLEADCNAHKTCYCLWDLKISRRLRMTVLWIVTPCRLVGRYRRFGGTCSLYLQAWCLLMSLHGVAPQRT